jgi:hypothetical protein
MDRQSRGGFGEEVRPQRPEGPWVLASTIVVVRFRDRVTLNGTSFLW